MDGGAATRIARLAVARRRAFASSRSARARARSRRRCSARGADVTAFDLDPDMVAILRARADLAAAASTLADALIYDFDAFGGGRAVVRRGQSPLQHRDAADDSARANGPIRPNASS